MLRSTCSQLAVVHGLVMDRVQTISRGAAVFKERCCRASYGVLCLEEYNPNNPAHVSSKMTIDPRDGKRWAEDQIDWFVKQVSTYCSNVSHKKVAGFTFPQGRKCSYYRDSQTLRNEDQPG